MLSSTGRAGGHGGRAVQPVLLVRGRGRGRGRGSGSQRMLTAVVSTAVSACCCMCIGAQSCMCFDADTVAVVEENMRADDDVLLHRKFLLRRLPHFG